MPQEEDQNNDNKDDKKPTDDKKPDDKKDGDDKDDKKSDSDKDKDKSTDKKDDKDKEDGEKAALKKRLDELEAKETERLEAEAKKKKEEDDAKKTQEQRDAERDLETKRLKQTLMVKDAREELGYTHKVFRHFDLSITAEDPALAKKQLEKVKSDLDEYVKSMGPVETPETKAIKDKASDKDSRQSSGSNKGAAFEMFGVGEESSVAV